MCPYYALRKTAWTLSPMFVYEKSYTFTKCMMMTQKKCSIVCLVIWKMFPCWNVIASSRFLSLMTFSFLLWHLDNCLVTMEVFFQTRCHSKRSIVYDCKCISDVYLFAKTCECDRGFLQGLTIQAHRTHTQNLFNVEKGGRRLYLGNEPVSYFSCWVIHRKPGKWWWWRGMVF